LHARPRSNRAKRIMAAIQRAKAVGRILRSTEELFNQRTPLRRLVSAMKKSSAGMKSIGATINAVRAAAFNAIAPNFDIPQIRSGRPTQIKNKRRSADLRRAAYLYFGRSSIELARTFV
jgi:hypothetical protein